MARLDLVEEAHPGRVGAVFASESTARAAAASLGREIGVARDRVEMIRPDDRGWADKVEPETAAIGRTLARSHIILGVGGLLAGFAVASALLLADLRMAETSPSMTFAFVGFLGAVAGLLVAGLISLRPDHDRVISRARTAANSGSWMIVVFTDNHEETVNVGSALKGMADGVVTSL
jgi:hypothetical protein